MADGTTIVSPLVRAVIDMLPDAAAVVDRSLKVVHANRQYLRLAGLSPRELGKGTLSEACHTQLGLEPCREGCLARRAMELERSIRLDEVASEKFKELRLIWVAVPLPNGSGGPEGCIEILRDVSAESRMQENYRVLLGKEKRRNEILQIEVKKRTGDLQRANDALNRALQQVSTLARTDPLTVLNNRRVFDEALQREIGRAARFSRVVTLLMLDIDKFQAVNNTRGSAAGDDILRALARLLERSIRSVDVVARIGGEEFAIVLPESPIDEAFALAERIRVEQERTGTTLSIGLAAYPDHARTAEELISAADQALSSAKERGRNRTVKAS